MRAVLGSKVTYEHHNEKHFWVAIEQAWRTAKKYFDLSAKTPTYTVATVFDPKKKLLFVQKRWGIYGHKLFTHKSKKHGEKTTKTSKFHLRQLYFLWETVRLKRSLLRG